MKNLYFCALSFVFIACLSLSLNSVNFNRLKFPTGVNDTSGVQAYETSVPYPQFMNKTLFPELSSYAILAVDIDSDIVLYQKNPNARLLPASTTKLVTALVARDNFSLDEIIRVPNLSVDGQKMRLVPGEEISVRNLIYGILVYSANDAAEVLAVNYPGGKQSFVGAMNLKVNDLGLEGTFFENPTGFDGNLQYTTAEDLVKIAVFALQDPFIKETVGIKEITVGSQDGRYIHTLNNINKLIGEVEGVKGIKTGWTENAKENLISYIERDGRRIVTVVLSSQDRFGDTKKLIQWIFDNFSWESNVRLF